MEPLGRLIMRLRARMNITIGEAAKQLSVSPSEYSALEYHEEELLKENLCQIIEAFIDISIERQNTEWKRKAKISEKLHETICLLKRRWTDNSLKRKTYVTDHGNGNISMGLK